MATRKIIKFGNSSYVVTVPLTWIEKNKLEKGSLLNLIEKDKSLIFSLEEKKEKKTATISLDNNPLKLFNKELLSYYLKNYQTITITGDDVLSKLEEIRILKDKVSSLEITEIEKNKVVLQDLTSPSELNLNKLIKEIIDMIALLFDELISDNIKEKAHLINQLDSNVNKLSFLAHKAINYNLESWENPEIMKNSNYYWRIISSLETIGDIIKRIARYLKTGDKDDISYFKNVLIEMKEYFIFITDILYVEKNINQNLSAYLDKKQSLLREFEFLRDKFSQKLNLYLVTTQLCKDILGKLDLIIISIIDLKLK